MTPRPPRPPLFPYTTLFRSPRHLPTVRSSATPPVPRARPGRCSPRPRRHRPPAAAHCPGRRSRPPTAEISVQGSEQDRKSTRLNSSHVAISYAVFCLKKKTKTEHRGTEG